MTDRPTLAALTALIILQVIMLGALYAGVAPHPPATIPPFAMAPFLGAAVAVAAAAMVLGTTESRAGQTLTALATLMALVSFGPHKALDPAFPLIWPAVVTAWVCAATIAARLYLTFTTRQRSPA